MSRKIPFTLALIGGLTALLILCTFYPFLPGRYDRLALPLSTIAQLFGGISLLFVPIGFFWLLYELRKQARLKRNHPHKDRRYSFALAAFIVASFIALILSLGALSSSGPALALALLALFAYLLSRPIPHLKRLKKEEDPSFHPAPLYLLIIPIAVLLLQLTLAAPAATFSRNRAIANSAELINDIENYHATYGRYPTSLLALWPDYDPAVVGVEQYYYAPNGDAYNLFFEQPPFLFINIGTREIVMYNKLDEHIIVSHANWILTSPPAELESRQGWYAVHDTLTPHWKYFWFD